MNLSDLEYGPEGREEEAANWCMRLAEGDLSIEEQQRFDSWIASGFNQRSFEDALAIWNGVDAAAEQAEFIRIRTAALEDFRKANRRRWSGKMFSRKRRPFMAAAACLLLALASLPLLQGRADVYQTDVGERRIATLDDGSRISLDAATRVDVALEEKQRALTLVSGRAKFDVAHDPLRPFSVTVGDKIVVATGTSFSVELVEGEVRVVLYEGHVEVLTAKDQGSPHPVKLRGSGVSVSEALKPGTELITSVSAPLAHVVQTDIPKISSWEAGQLTFDNEPLATAVARVNRYAPRKVMLANPSVAEIRISGVFTAGDTDSFLEAVTAFAPVGVERGGGQITLSMTDT